MSTTPDPDQATDRLGAELAEVFLELAETLSPEDTEELVPEIDEHLEQVREALSGNEFLDVELAEQIAAACRALLGVYGDLDDARQAAVIGAVQYFLHVEDADDDFDSVIGFEDDAKVVNYVIELTGEEIAPIEISED